MPVPPHIQIKPGTLVSIVLKQDQRTGRQVQGAVSQVLTRGNHPRGVKVRLSDGRIGRVQQLVSGNITNQPSLTTPSSQKPYRTMADHNPWASDDTRGSGYNNQNQYSQQPAGNPQQRFYQEPQQPSQPRQPRQPQQPQQPQGYQYQSYSSDQAQYDQPSYQSHDTPYNPPAGQPYEQSYSQQPSYNAWEDTTGNPPLPARHPARNAVPSQHISRSDTDELLASEPDRAEQMEHMQAYEATANESIDDKNRAQLEKEFPNIDGSLIAALYGDNKDLSETRELLQELGRQ